MKVFVVIDEHGYPAYVALDRVTCNEHVNSAIAEHGIAEAAMWSVVEFSTDVPPPPAETLPCRPARPPLPAMFDYSEKP